MAREHVNTADFRGAMSLYATGVVIVTTNNDGHDHGMTANSFTSVSLDPPLVLVCVDRSSRFHAAVSESRRWAVSVLTEQQRDVASWFATRGRPLSRQFSGFGTQRGSRSNSLIMAGCLASFECETFARYPGGDHDIIVGYVEHLSISSTAAKETPLLYYHHTLQGLME